LRSNGNARSLWLTKSLSILNRRNERLCHLCVDVIPVEVVQLIQPEVEAVKVEVWPIIRVSSEVTEILHQHKGRVEFLLRESLILDYLAQHRTSRLGPHLQASNQTVASSYVCHASIGEEGVYKFGV